MNTGSMNTVRPGRMAASVVVNAGLPLLVYTLLRPHVGSDAAALAIGAAIPVTATVAVFAWRRWIDPIGVLSVAGFCVALIVLAFSGGNALVLELQDSLITGPIGLVCLLSAAVRRPLHLVLMRFLARNNPGWEQRLRSPGLLRTSIVVTALVGAMLVLHALALLVLALVEPTATFLALSRPIGLAIIGAGVAVLLWYRNRRQVLAGADQRGAG